MVNAIVSVFHFFLYELPKFLLVELLWGILQELKCRLIAFYKSIPPMREWPGIIWRGLCTFATGCKEFAIDLAYAIKQLPRWVYETAKQCGLSVWEAIKAIPGAIRNFIELVWTGLKNLGNWVVDLFLRYLSQ
jgi:hypothetical protein